jgi:hypothetical protein
MADDLIPNDVKRFILDNIDSVAHMEGLLLLRSDPQTEWTIEEAAKRLYISSEQATDVLARLSATGFLIASASGVYKYLPHSTELAQMGDCIAEVYAKYLIPVTNLIHSKPKPKVQQFADAFRLRKDK